MQPAIPRSLFVSQNTKSKSRLETDKYLKWPLQIKGPNLQVPAAVHTCVAAVKGKAIHFHSLNLQLESEVSNDNFFEIFLVKNLMVWCPVGGAHLRNS